VIWPLAYHIMSRPPDGLKHQRCLGEASWTFLRSVAGLSHHVHAATSGRL